MIWLAIITRSDIAYTVSKLAIYLTNPTQDHMDAVIWYAEYLLHSKADSICIGGEQSSLNLKALSMPRGPTMLTTVAQRAVLYSPLVVVQSSGSLDANL
jgi:hypothetical protein